VLIFGLSVPGSGCGRMTIQVPHFGHVMHEHTMRWAIEKLYGRPASFRCLQPRSDRQPATYAEEELLCVFSK
jgi:hypothetical protein